MQRHVARGEPALRLAKPALTAAKTATKAAAAAEWIQPMRVAPKVEFTVPSARTSAP